MASIPKESHKNRSQPVAALVLESDAQDQTFSKLIACAGVVMAKKRNLKREKAERNREYARQFQKRSSRNRRQRSFNSDDENTNNSNNSNNAGATDD